MTTMEEIVKKADLLRYRGEKREEYLKQEFKLLAERQEKKEEAERQERKEEAERQARKKKEEAERQERKEKEEADRKERLELEIMKIDEEMKLLQAIIETGFIKNEPERSSARSSDAGAKHPKLPNFQDGRDDLDIWLTRFERFAESNGWSREKWSSSLCALLTGRALDCYGRHSAEQGKDYDKVKEALMKRYDLMEDGYRRKFRTCKSAEGESPDMFIVRIVTYLDRWIELSKTDKYEKLKDLIVREQFIDACPEDLATSLREKDLPTLESVAKEADLFLKGRNRKLCDQPRKVFQGNARPRIDSVRSFEPEKKFNGGQRAGEAKTSVADQRKFSVGEKVLVLLPTDSNKLLMQWKGPFEIVATVGINDYRINMGGKEKTFHANLLKGYIARDQNASQANMDGRSPTSNSAIPAASVTVIEDLEGEHFNDSDCEALPELGGWGSEETVNDLKYGDELTLDQHRQLEEVAPSSAIVLVQRPQRNIASS
ncbi:hypothetical protein PoB_003459300 [Plakobranchus ocellatus]|uniref:SCAN box domain-containing protein n=1 Tax=Plakobranchus ocellatus TaxID=259542 RepID=A0AAV4AMR3_9GAST|nr:hypothetical protein PoB_003459300 [Plakobranchus ocellatus]